MEELKKSDLEVILPRDDNKVKLNDGTEIIVGRMKMRQLTDVLTAAGPMLDDLKEQGKKQLGIQLPVIGKLDSDLAAPTVSADRAADPVGQTDILGLIEKHGLTLTKTVAILIDKPLVWVGDLEMDEMIRVTTKVLEVNLDFFIQRVFPELSGVLSGLTVMMQARQQLMRGATDSSN